MKYLSVCSGIEAVSVAWHPLGFEAVAYSEIDAFPSAVLSQHYPGVPNWGDLTKCQEWPDAVVDVLVGGTPCQSFSVAGLRKGLDDPRGSLLYAYLAVARRYRPRWLVWENVPGVLSVDDGRAFGSLLGGLAELGYGFAYRILDAQHFHLAQRRARVFVVGHLGDWRRAAAVLFERASLSGHPAPRREAGETAPTVPSRRTAGGGLGTDFDCDGGLVNALTVRGSDSSNAAVDENRLLAFGGNNTSGPIDVATAVQAHGGPHGRQDFGSETFIAEPMTLAIRGRGDSHDLEYRQDGIANAVLTPNGGRGGIGVGAVAMTFDWQAGGGGADTSFRGKSRSYVTDQPERTRAITANKTLGLQQGMSVRRLTPRECERLQGFPDDYTLITYRGKPAADGPRYKALGNSMAVPVMAWIGKRIQLVEGLESPDV